MRFLLISDTHETPGGSETPGTARPGIAELPWPGEAESEACSSARQSTYGTNRAGTPAATFLTSTPRE